MVDKQVIFLISVESNWNSTIPSDILNNCIEHKVQVVEWTRPGNNVNSSKRKYSMPLNERGVVIE